MLEELARDQLADVARADDDACSARRAGLRRQHAAGERPQRRDERDRERARRPPASRGRDRRARSARSARRRPGADGDEVEDADDVVDRRVVGALLVAVVEAVELRDHDPDRERRRRAATRRSVHSGRRRAGPSAAAAAGRRRASPTTSATTSARRTSRPRRPVVRAGSESARGSRTTGRRRSPGAVVPLAGTARPSSLRLLSHPSSPTTTHTGRQDRVRTASELARPERERPVVSGGELAVRGGDCPTRVGPARPRPSRRRDVSRDDGARSDERSRADPDATEDDGARADDARASTTVSSSCQSIRLWSAPSLRSRRRWSLMNITP